MHNTLVHALEGPGTKAGTQTKCPGSGPGRRFLFGFRPWPLALDHHDHDHVHDDDDHDQDDDDHDDDDDGDVDKKHSCVRQVSGLWRFSFRQKDV